MSCALPVPRFSPRSGHTRDTAAYICISSTLNSNRQFSTSYISFTGSFSSLIQPSAMELEEPTRASDLTYDTALMMWRTVTSIFFREIRPRGAYNIPKEGPVILVAAPHSNQVRFRSLFPCCLLIYICYSSWIPFF